MPYRVKLTKVSTNQNGLLTQSLRAIAMNFHKWGKGFVLLTVKPQAGVPVLLEASTAVRFDCNLTVYS